MWVYFALTVVSTLYFGWHYIADDIAGAVIAWSRCGSAALATGQRFDRHGRGSHPTTSTARRARSTSSRTTTPRTADPDGVDARRRALAE